MKIFAWQNQMVGLASPLLLVRIFYDQILLKRTCLDAPVVQRRVIVFSR